MTTETKPLTKSQKVANDLSALMRARTPLIWVTTIEEARVEGYVAQAAAQAGYTPIFWDVAQGITKLDGKVTNDYGDNLTDAGAALSAIKARADKSGSTKENNFRTAWIMRDVGKWLEGPLGFTPLRALRNLSKFLPGVKRDNAQSIIVLSADSKVPDDLKGHATVVEWPLPDRAEIAAILEAALQSIPEAGRAEACSKETFEQAVDSAVGLNGEEAASCYAKSLVQTKRIDPAIISSEKKRVIAKSGVLTWVEPITGGMDAVGGLENLKAWLRLRKSAYSPAARAYGLPAPKGVGLVGIPGCGKSLTAKAVPTEWGVPCIRLDLGALKGKFVGDSEGNMRKALSTIEAIGRCVVWIDEIEKALAGSTGGSSADGGVSQDQLGTLLTWLSDRASEAFVMVTANDIEGLPPELLRKGRFDEIFFIDFPNFDEAKSVLKTALVKAGRGKVEFDLDSVALECKEYTGSEIAELVPAALFVGFNDNAREITTADLLNAAKEVVPLAKTSARKIERLKAFRDEGRATPATAKEAGHFESRTGRQLDL